MNVEFKHTLTVDRGASYLRFYVWLWEGDLDKISFCKLFWAYVFAVPGMFLRFGIFAPLVWVAAHAPRPRFKRTAKSLKGPPQMQRVLGRIETTGARVVQRFGSAWRVVSFGGRLQYWGGRLLMVLGGLIGAGLVAGVGYLVVSYFSTAVIVTAAIAGLIASVAAVLVLKALGVIEVIGDLMLSGGRRARAGALGFFGVMRAGYIAVKSNTCPRIEVTTDKERAS